MCILPLESKKSKLIIFVKRLYVYIHYIDYTYEKGII